MIIPFFPRERSKNILVGFNLDNQVLTTFLSSIFQNKVIVPTSQVVSFIHELFPCLQQIFSSCCIVFFLGKISSCRVIYFVSYSNTLMGMNVAIALLKEYCQWQCHFFSRTPFAFGECRFVVIQCLCMFWFSLRNLQLHWPKSYECWNKKLSLPLSPAMLSPSLEYPTTSIENPIEIWHETRLNGRGSMLVPLNMVVTKG